MTDKIKLKEGPLGTLTNSVKQGILVDGVAKNESSSSSSARTQKKLGWSPFFSFSEFTIAYKSVKKGKKKKPKELPDYRNSINLDDSELTLLGKFNKNYFLELVKLYLELNIFHTYAIKHYKAFTVPKNSGKGERPIFSPDPRDRVVFTIVLNRIKKSFYFLNNYNIMGIGLSGEKDNPKRFIPKINSAILSHKYYLKVDIDSFFPSIDRDKLIAKLKSISIDPIDLKSLAIIQESIHTEIDYKREDKKYFEAFLKGRGIPQGCAYSPLLANFYFCEIDKFLTRRKIVYFRYLDDILILSESLRGLDEIFKVMQRMVEQNLNLRFKKEKNERGRTSDTISFLGLDFINGNIYVSDKSVKNLLKHIESHIHEAMEEKQISDTRVHIIEILNSWSNYYSNIAPIDYQLKKTNINDALVGCYVSNYGKHLKDFIVDKDLLLQ